ncbi:hypothetical protein B0H14DRAFT_2592212 [Mycena olivaceomarginata]|nr:hypothetical protein B0H14DRAFT_2617467 [Mycena olivaceomarginata]KAJ7832261.1 hypothetical protein B0H14DRAFT_2592212 [Mycena olivaceomarginata]
MARWVPVLPLGLFQLWHICFAFKFYSPPGFALARKILLGVLPYFDCASVHGDLHFDEAAAGGHRRVGLMMLCGMLKVITGEGRTAANVGFTQWVPSDFGEAGCAEPREGPL